MEFPFVDRWLLQFASQNACGLKQFSFGSRTCWQKQWYHWPPILQRPAQWSPDRLA
jgi:hypothetical protein